MPSALTFPGVYIEEKSSGVHTISGVATSIAAFVGYTKSGLDNRAKQIFSFSDYERSFGGLASDSELSYAVQQFFQNGGAVAYVVRVPKDQATQAQVTLLNGIGVGVTASLKVQMLSKGSWSNSVIIDVDYDAVTDTVNGFNLTITDLATGTTETFSNVTIDNTKTNFVEAIVNDPDNGSKLVLVTATPSNGRPAATGITGSDLDLTKPNFGIKNDQDYKIKINIDAPSQSILFTFIKSGTPLPNSIATVCSMLERQATAAVGSAIPGARVLCVPSSSGKGLRVRLMIPAAYDAQATFTAGTPNDADAFLKLSAGNATANVSHYWPNSQRSAAAWAQTGTQGGSDGSALPTAVELIGDPSQFTGIYALDKVDLFNILCIPDATRAKASDPSKSDNPGDYNAIFSAALAYCKSRRAFLIIDPPPEVSDVDKATDWISSQLTVHDPQGNAAAYFPRLKLPDPLNNLQLRTFAPCGVVAKVYARTDSARGVWKAPAGVEATLDGVQGMVYSLTDNENGALNPLGLNCFRIFPIYGPVAWGARTIAGADAAASEWKYVPVRRFALFLEESLYRGTKWVVFEPNDEPLWAQIRLNLGAFLHTLFLQGAFQGNTPQKAYFVKCDSETTTQDDINRGVVNIIVGFAPLKPAEFVVIQIQQMAGQIQT
ncbi:Phage tail sheath protein [Burkholderia sp. YR290]|nr:Phage tail sheath protein [Burkholderia sp. YR290]